VENGRNKVHANEKKNVLAQQRRYEVASGEKRGGSESFERFKTLKYAHWSRYSQKRGGGASPDKNRRQGSDQVKQGGGRERKL